jgi:hypothetical protein
MSNSFKEKSASHQIEIATFLLVGGFFLLVSNTSRHRLDDSESDYTSPAANGIQTNRNFSDVATLQGSSSDLAQWCPLTN